ESVLPGNAAIVVAGHRAGRQGHLGVVLAMPHPVDVGELALNESAVDGHPVPGDEDLGLGELEDRLATVHPSAERGIGPGLRRIALLDQLAGEDDPELGQTDDEIGSRVTFEDMEFGAAVTEVDTVGWRRRSDRSDV